MNYKANIVYKKRLAKFNPLLVTPLLLADFPCKNPRTQTHNILNIQSLSNI